MSIAIRCECGKSINVPGQHAGKKIRCRQCGRIIVVPTPSPAAPLTARLSRWIRSRRAAKAGSVKPRSILAPGRREVVFGYLAWAALAVTCLIALLLWQLGDVWWPMTVFLFIGRWILLVPLGLLAVVALLLRRQALVPLVLAAMVVSGPIMGFRVGVGRLLPHPVGLHLRAVSINSDQKNLGAGLSQFLEQVQPDLLAIQECGESMRATVQQLGGWFHHNTDNLCFISRYPLADSAQMDRTVLARIHGQSDEGIGGSGNVVRYIVQTPQGAMNVTNLHLETPRKGLEPLLSGDFDLSRLRDNTSLRGIESDLARRFVNQGTLPTIVIGDFNTPVESQIFQRSWGDLTDAFSHAGFGFGFTKFNGWIRARIDHVLAGRDVYVDHVSVGDDVDSDHRPLIVDLTVIPKPGTSPAAGR